MNKLRQPGDSPAYTYMAKKRYWRFRYKGFEAPLPGSPGDPDFEAKYGQLLASVVRPAPVAPNPVLGTFDFVLRRFYSDVEFRALSPRTQANYHQFGKTVSRLLGECPMQTTTVEMIAAVRNGVSIGTAEVMRRFISRLYVFASDRKYITQGLNVAACLRPIKRKTAGHEPWSDDEIALMFRHATGAIRTLMIIALCTGLRPGDVETLTWSQVLGDFVRVRQRKTNEVVLIPIHPILRAELDRLRAEGPVGGVIVRKSTGRPIGEGGFYYRMRSLVRKIPDMPWRTPHGSRYAAAAMLNEVGCTVDQASSILGHRTYQMAMHYLTKRGRAMEAMTKMIRHAALLNLPSPDFAPAGPARSPTMVLLPPPRIGRVSLAKTRQGEFGPV